MENEVVTAAATEAADASAGLSEAGSAGAEQTADEILGLGDTGAETSEVTETTETPEATEAVDAELPLDSAPEWLKPLFSNEDPKIAAQAKSYWNQIQALSELGTVAQVRAIKQEVDQLGGIDGLKELQQKAMEIDEVDSAFYSADPEKQRDLLGRQYQDDPDAFRSAFQVGAELIREIEPAVFDQFLGEAFKGKLSELSGMDERTGASKFEMHLDAIRDAAYRRDEEQLSSLGNQLARWFMENSSKLGLSNKKNEPRLDANRLALDRDREKFNSERQSYGQERYDRFIADAGSSINKNIEGVVAELVNKSLAGVKISEGAKKRIISDTFNAVEKAVAEDAAHRNQVLRLIVPSGKTNDFTQYKTDRATLQQVVNLAIARGKQALPGIAKRVIGEWTNDIISTNRSAAARAKAAARPDISGGVPKNYAGKKPLTAEDARKMSADDILNYDGPAAR